MTEQNIMLGQLVRTIQMYYLYLWARVANCTYVCIIMCTHNVNQVCIDKYSLLIDIYQDIQNRLKPLFDNDALYSAFLEYIQVSTRAVERLKSLSECVSGSLQWSMPTFKVTYFTISAILAIESKIAKFVPAEISRPPCLWMQNWHLANIYTSKMYKTVKSPQKKSTCENMSPVELSVGRGGRYRHWLSFFAWAYELNWGNYRSLLFLSISVCQVEWKLYNSMLIQLKQYEGAITANQPAPTNTSIDLNPIINALSPGSELLAEVKSLTPLLDALLECPSHIVRKAVSLPSTKRQTLVDLVSEGNVVIQWCSLMVYFAY